MPVPGPLELVLILVIVAMLFGVGKLPEVFGSVGKGIREFRKESSIDGDSTSATATEVATPPAAPTPAEPAADTPVESASKGQSA
jgi:sec-independent protein translocase protein TatA